MTPSQRIALGVALLSGLAVGSRIASPPWLVNETSSVPRGLYLRTSAPPAPGRIVTVRPPAPARTYAAGLGVRPGAMLLKRVAAGAGETVCRDGERMTWPLGSARARSHDRQGRTLPAWRGCRRLDRDEVLVVGDSPASFDSRYFGPVRFVAVEGVYREVWRW